jgi:protein-tyrosine phosphatase
VNEAPARPGEGGGEGAQTDLHSHLVPGVDDGSRDLDDVLEGVGRMVDRGVTTIVTTPHLDGSLTLESGALERRLSRMDAAFEEARAAVARSHPELRFLRGHEVKLDCPDPDLSDSRLRLADSDFVLVEWPGLLIPPGTPRVLRSLRSQGREFLIAHVERYRGYDEGMTIMERWREEEVFFQVNHGSLAGRYGTEARKRALRMLQEGWVDCLASDFHGRPELRLYLTAARRLFRELEGEEAWTLLTEVNPARIAANAKPLPVPRLKMGRGVWDRLTNLFR